MVARKKMSNVRVGVVGLGMGTLHVKQFQSCNNVEVVALCDVNKDLLLSRQQEYNIPQAYTDMDKMLSQGDLDGLVVAVPNMLHAPLSIKALKAGVHVLCEKPMAMNTKDAEKMRQAARAAKRHLLINFNQRFGQEAWALKRVVESGELGGIYAAKCGWIRRYGIPGTGGWFTTRKRSGGGALVDIGVHALDLTLWFMGHPEVDTALAGTYAMFGPQAAAKAGGTFDVDDLAYGLVKFKNGATLFLEASWASHIEHRDAFYSELLGDKGGALRRWDGRGSFSTVFKTQNGSWINEQLVQPLDHPPSSMQHFVDVIRDGVKPIPTAEDGVRVMAVLDALNASAGKALTTLKGSKAAKAAGTTRKR